MVVTGSRKWSFVGSRLAPGCVETGKLPAGRLAAATSGRSLELGSRNVGTGNSHFLPLGSGNDGWVSLGSLVILGPVLRLGAKKEKEQGKDIIGQKGVKIDEKVEEKQG
uniref:Uncharacterized protein n=1 Tax=Solanum tuberosum TaxID=4113 RepID=M1DCR6_SOLTU